MGKKKIDWSADRTAEGEPVLAFRVPVKVIRAFRLHAKRKGHKSPGPLLVEHMARTVGIKVKSAESPTRKAVAK